MSISAISSSSVTAAYAPPAPQTQLPQQTKVSLKAPVTDTVTISKQAQQLLSDGDTQAQEVTESGAEKATEAASGKS